MYIVTHLDEHRRPVKVEFALIMYAVEYIAEHNISRYRVVDNNPRGDVTADVEMYVAGYRSARKQQQEQESS